VSKTSVTFQKWDKPQLLSDAEFWRICSANRRV